MNEPANSSVQRKINWHQTEERKITSMSFLFIIDRCQCGCCTVMDREEECVCCQEVPATHATCSSLPNETGQAIPICITQHPGFASVCVNKW